MNSPLISVILPTYNTASMVGYAIDSILSQTETNFELIILNNGSTDKTKAVIASYAQQDKRIIAVHYETHHSLPYVLNQGFELAKGVYVAHQGEMFSSRPERLAQQLAYLEKYVDIGLVGMPVSIANKTRQVEKSVIPHQVLSSTLIPWELLIAPYFVLETVMAHRDLLMNMGGYDAKQGDAWGYDFWVCLSYVTQLAMLPDIGAMCAKEEALSSIVTAFKSEDMSLVRSHVQSDLLGQKVSIEEADWLAGFIKEEPIPLEKKAWARKQLEAVYSAYIKRYNLSEKEYLLLKSSVEVLLKQ